MAALQQQTGEDICYAIESAYYGRCKTNHDGNIDGGMHVYGTKDGRQEAQNRTPLQGIG